MTMWVLDPFAGGDKSGYVGKNGEKESDIVLKAVLEAKKHLERNGEKVTLTRNSDEYISDESKIEIINESNADILITFRMSKSEDENKKGVRVTYSNEKEDQRYLSQLIKSEIQSELNTEDCGSFKEDSIYDNLNCDTITVYGEFISNSKVMNNFDGEKYGYMVAKACLAFKDKVLLTGEKTVPKKMQKRAYRVCVGYYYDYDSAMDKVLDLNKEGIKDAYVVPYEGN